MKRILIAILFLLPLMSFAQQDKLLNYKVIDMKPFHFGYTIGFNTMDFGIYPSEKALQNDTFPELNKLAPGIDVGIVTNFRLSEYWDFRFLPGISLGQRNLLYYNSDDEAFVEMILGSTYINMPFLIRYEAKRQNNFRPFLIGGVNFRWDMAKNKDFNADKGIYVKLKPFDVYAEAGFGVDFYLPYFKLTTEIKYSVGNLNILSPDKDDTYPGYVESIDKLKSRMFTISFHFE